MTKNRLLSSGTVTDKNKKSATSIIGQKPEMEGRKFIIQIALDAFCHIATQWHPAFGNKPIAFDPTSNIF
jgi:hypothetical protein